MIKREKHKGSPRGGGGKSGILPRSANKEDLEKPFKIRYLLSEEVFILQGQYLLSGSVKGMKSTPEED